MKYLVLLICLSLLSCSSAEKPPIDQENAVKTPEMLKFPPNFYARPVKGEKSVVELPKA